MRFSSTARRLLHLPVNYFILSLVLTDSHHLVWNPASGFRNGPGLQLLNILLSQMSISDTLYSLLFCDGTSATLALINTSCHLCCLGPVAALFSCRSHLYQAPSLHLYLVANYREQIDAFKSAYHTYTVTEALEQGLSIQMSGFQYLKVISVHCLIMRFNVF